jgi:hypothetical protein
LINVTFLSLCKRRKMPLQQLLFTSPQHWWWR